MKALASAIAAAAVAVAALPAQAQQGSGSPTLDAVKARGQLICGANGSVAGFGMPNARGEWTGLDVDVCRAVAAAVFGDATKVRYVATTAQQRFTALQSGEIDLLVRNTTWTLSRDTSLGLDFLATNFYDGQGFMVPKKLNVKSAKQLKGATVCVQSGTTTELNMTDFSRANKLDLKPVVFADLQATNAAYFAGRCQAYTTDASGLASIRAKEAKDPNEHVILPELISKEPLGPAVRRGDDEFEAIVKWVGFALIEAEEYGVTQANVDQLKSSSTNPAVMRLLGMGNEDTGKLLGLDKEWAYRAIKAVGNYGEQFERHVGPKTAIGLPRGVNNLWTNGGVMYAPPVR